MTGKHPGQAGQGDCGRHAEPGDREIGGDRRWNRRAVPVGEAQGRLLDCVEPLPAETVPLWQGGGRYLAEPAEATADWPPFPRAGMDGYAVRAADTRAASPGSPVRLRVIGSVAAGGLADAAIAPGTAVRIMTGAAVPEGADAVVMLEQTAPAAMSGEPAVLVKQPAVPGQHIAPRGGEFRRGDAIAGPGERLAPGHIAQLGAFGYAGLRVHRRPKAAVLATGTELLPVEAALRPGRVRDSNSAMLAALISGCGAEPLMLGRAPDDPAAVDALIAAALREADIVVTTGGVSVGDRDVMAALLREPPAGGVFASARVLFDKTAMRPGSPTSAALLEGKPLIALSGNPGACFVGFELFVRPALLKLAGCRAPLPGIVQVVLAAPVDKPSPHDRYVRARLYAKDGILYGEPLPHLKSGMMASLPDTGVLLRIPSGSAGARQGEPVAALIPADWPGLTGPPQ